MGEQNALVRSVITERRVRLVYQPVVNLHTREVFAYEALVRCDAFKSPPELFDAAIAAGLVGDLGRMLRDESVKNCPSHTLFLNVHPAELNQGFLVRPDDPIFNHGKDVYLEITESVPLSHFKLCLAMLHEIRDKGVYLVVDDLGAGFSNLKYIADLHPRVVKLDRELVAGIRRRTRLHTLVKSIVKMCVDLGALVVAEGIETADELHAICETGAHFGQGYLLARPAFPLPPPVWPTS
jgi:EAL domain-containing protein (putative c-di-GMP-specific phosphodiesterase class I)